MTVFQMLVVAFPICCLLWGYWDMRQHPSDKYFRVQMNEYGTDNEHFVWMSRIDAAHDQANLMNEARERMVRGG